MARVRLLATGAAVAHMGFALMFAGIIGSSVWGESERLRLPLGEPVDAVGATFVYEGHIDGSEPEDLIAVDGLDRDRHILEVLRAMLG